jgi:hypothetical protein
MCVCVCTLEEEQTLLAQWSSVFLYVIEREDHRRLPRWGALAAPPDQDGSEWSPRAVHDSRLTRPAAMENSIGWPALRVIPTKDGLRRPAPQMKQTSTV